MIEAESNRLRSARNLRDFDGGTQKTYQRMIQEMDLQIGRVLEALHVEWPGGEHDRHFHQRQRRRTIRGYVAFHRPEDGTAGRRTANTGYRFLAGAHPAGRTIDQVAITMDWMPTLLAAAGVSPDPAFPPDGINLLPMLTQNAAPVERKLFWRYKANAQRAARDGDFKYLKILDNTFLFNVVEDPMERANLKERRKDIYDRIVAEWHAWNATMLPEIDESSTDNFTGDQLADHIGTSERAARRTIPQSDKIGRLMKQRKASLWLAVALLLGTLPVTAQELPRATPAQVGISQERLDHVIQVLRDDTGQGLVPGAVILVARHGKIAAFEASGLLDPATKRPMTRDAIFRIYSMSKPITTVCAMMLVEEGK